MPPASMLTPADGHNGSGIGVTPFASILKSIWCVKDRWLA